MAYGSVDERIILTPFLCGWRKHKCFLRKKKIARNAFPAITLLLVINILESILLKIVMVLDPCRGWHQTLLSSMTCSPNDPASVPPHPSAALCSCSLTRLLLSSLYPNKVVSLWNKRNILQQRCEASRTLQLQQYRTNDSLQMYWSRALAAWCSLQ